MKLSNPSKTAIYVGGLVLTTLLMSCGPKTNATKTPAPETAAPRVTKVRAFTATEGVLRSNRTAGVTLSPARESNVASTASGKVVQIMLEEGSQVKAGQVVIRLDAANAQTQLRNAQLAVDTAKVNLQRASRSTDGSIAPLKAAQAAAQANLEVAQRRYSEGQQLFKTGAIAQVDLTGLEAALGQAQSAAQNATESLGRAQRASTEDLALLKLQIEQAQNQLVQAQRALNDANIRAPFAGVVAENYVNLGEFVAAGSRAFRLADTSSLEAKFRIPPSEAAKLPVGTGLNLDYGGRTYFARLSRTAQVPGNDRLVEAIATVSAPLTPGATANLRYNLELAKGVLVPSGALLSGDRPQVMVVVNQKAVVKTVQILGDNGSKAALAGVASGSKVVYPVPPSLRDGDTLEVVE